MGPTSAPAPAGPPSAPSPAAPRSVPTAAPTALPTTPETASASPSPAALPPAPPADPPPADRSAPRPPLLDRLPEAIAAPVHAVATVGVAVVRHAQYPSAVFALAGFFLLAQRRIDRDDPKLALAPVAPDDRVPFETPGVAPW